MLQTSTIIVARKMNIELDFSNVAASTLRTGGCTDMAQHDATSWVIEMTRRWSSKKGKKICINAD